MNNNAILSMQAGSLYFNNLKFLKIIHRNLTEIFDNVIMFEIFPPSFQAPWIICLASDYGDLTKTKRTDISGLKFYSTDFHPHLLSNLSPNQYEVVYRDSK